MDAKTKMKFKLVYKIIKQISYKILIFSLTSINNGLL